MTFETNPFGILNESIPGFSSEQSILMQLLRGHHLQHELDGSDAVRQVWYSRTQVLPMRNNSGGNVERGLSVKLDTAITTSLSFTTSTTANDSRVCGITLEDIPATGTGLVAIGGYVQHIRVAAGTTIYQFLRQSSTAGVLEGTTTPTGGTEAIALSDRDATLGTVEGMILHMHTGIDADTTAPRFTMAVVNGTSLRILYDEQLDTASTPATTTFAVLVNGGSRSVSSVSINGSVVVLTLSSAVNPQDTVTVAYTAGVTPIQDIAGNDAANFAAQTCINATTDNVAPTFSQAYVFNTGLRIEFSERLAGTTPATTAFDVQVNSVARTVSTVTIEGSSVRLTLSSGTTWGDTVTVAYTQPGVSNLEDLAGNDVANFTAQTVTNIESDTTAPRFAAAYVNGATLKIHIDEFLDTGSTPATTAFDVQVNAGARTVNTVTLTGNVVTLALASAVVSSDTVTVAYTQPGSNRLRDRAANNAASFTAQTVINVTDFPVTDVQTFTGNGTWTKPAGGAKWTLVQLWGGGASGGGGKGINGAGAGGSGGGAGAYLERLFDAADLGATESVTIGAGGASAAGGANADGTNGNAGGNTSFGSQATAYGGGGGKGGDATSGVSGGGGGGSGSAGGAGQSAANSTGGNPQPGYTESSTNGSVVGNSGARGPQNDAGGNAEDGGAAGGSAGQIAGKAGGSSIRGPGAGGGGGGSVNGTTENAGGAGGANDSYTAGGGGAAGAADGGAGTGGTSRSGTGRSGDGGGGGGSQGSGTGGAGGAGGIPGGGGGGGGMGNTTGGASGAGARGEMIVTTFF